MKKSSRYIFILILFVIISIFNLLNHDGKEKQNIPKNLINFKEVERIQIIDRTENRTKEMYEFNEPTRFKLLIKLLSKISTKNAHDAVDRKSLYDIYFINKGFYAETPILIHNGGITFKGKTVDISKEEMGKILKEISVLINK